MFRAFASRLSLTLVLLALALAATLATSLEVTASGLVAVVLAAGGLVGGLAPRRNPGWAGWCVLAAVGYAAWRMVNSPVADLARRDGLLLAAGGLSFAWAACLASSSGRRAWQAAVLALAVAGVGVAVYQAAGHPAYTPFFTGRDAMPHASGFYAHYNHFANFMLAAGFLAAGWALAGTASWRWRIVAAGVAAACFTGLVLSQSRGGFVGLGVGLLVLAFGWLLDLKRRKSGGFRLVLLGLVVLVPLFGAAWWWGADHFLESRKSEQTGELMSNPDDRANYYSFALEQALDHPLAGAGSRSYSYEYLRYWKKSAIWRGGSDIQYVHNEFLQTAADYGFVGLGLLGIALMAVMAKGCVTLAVEPVEKSARVMGPAEIIGGLAAMAAVLTQSMFSFVLHMTPDVIVLGGVMGLICAQPGPFARAGMAGRRRWAGAVMTTGMALAAVAVAWRDAAAWWWVGSPRAQAVAPAAELRHDAWKRAAAVRPDFEFEAQAAEVASRLAEQVEPRSRQFWEETAVREGDASLARHPHQPYLRLNQAVLLDRLGRFDEAETEFRTVLPLLDVPGQALHVRFLYGSHCYRRGYALWRSRRAEEGLAWALEAKRQMELARKSHWFAPDSPEGKELAAVEAFIRWLEGAQIKPAEGVGGGE